MTVGYHFTGYHLYCTSPKGFPQGYSTPWRGGNYSFYKMGFLQKPSHFDLNVFNKTKS